MGSCAIISFRLGLSDGVSVVAAAWEDALTKLGWTTVRVGGDGPVDRLIPGLAIGADAPPDRPEIEAALADADVVLVENLLSIPMNLPASRVVAEALRGRPAILHHHDPPWQRERFAHITELPPDDPAWHHVTINRLTRAEFADRGLDAVTIYNGFDPDPAPGDRAATRAGLGVADDEILVAHPVRAIERKNVPGAVALTEHLGGVYWLPGPAEEDYQAELDRHLADAGCPVLRHGVQDRGLVMADLYAAADVVAFPSTWEGFGNPPVEAALHRRPVVVGHYPVAEELRALGFAWYGPDEPEAVAAGLADPDDPSAGPGGRLSLNESLEHNRDVARRHLSTEAMTAEIEALFATVTGGDA